MSLKVEEMFPGCMGGMDWKNLASERMKNTAKGIISVPVYGLYVGVKRSYMQARAQ